jgi:predicted Fe-Mo cluster-binding NifX family protein
MKYVAAAYEPGEAMPYFEQASYFQVNIFVQGRPRQKQLISLPEGSTGEHISLLIDMGVDVVICRGFGPRTLKLFADAGIPLRDSSTNQQFVELTNKQMQHLMQDVLFETWEPIDEDNTLCRFVTSWATTDRDLEALKNTLETL